MKNTLVLVWLLALLAIGSRVAGSPVTLGEVTAEPWLRVELGELTIITDASEGKLREWAAEMTWFRNGLRTALPLPPSAVGEPATLFLFKSDRTMRRYLPDFGKNPMLLSGFFASAGGNHVGIIGLSGSRFDVRAKLFHEMTHWHLAGSGVDVPLWFHEGLAQVFESFTLQGDAFRLGHSQPDMLHTVKIAGTPALGGLLNQVAVDYSRAGWKHGHTNLFYAQSWSLTHMLLFGSKRGSLARATGYLNALRSGLTGPEAFAAGFGLTAEAAREQLDVYVRDPRASFMVRPLDRSATRESFQVGPLAPGELYRQFGLLLLAAGHADAAAQFVTYACATAGDDPRSWELAGLLALSRQPIEQLAAEEAFEKARSRSSRNPWVYMLLASRLAEGIAPGGNPESDLLREDRLREAGKLLLAALAVRPDFKPGVEALAGIVLVSANPRPEFREAVRAGLVAAAGSPVVQVAVADEEIRTGQMAPAAKRLEKLLGRPAELPAEISGRIREMLDIARSAPSG